MTDTTAKQPRNVLRDHFESVPHMLGAIESRPVAWRQATSRATYRPEWYGTPNLGDAISVARIGWPQGRNLAATIRDRLTAHTTIGIAPSQTLDVAGAYPLAALAAAGDPLSMVDLAPTEDRARPIVRIVASVSASATYQASEIVNYGASVAAVIDALESAAFRVELTVTNAVRQGDEAFVATCIVKQAGDHPDLDAIAFALTHPSMLRRLMFAVHETHASHEGRFMLNYGQPWVADEMPWLDAGQIFIPGINLVPPGSPALKRIETTYPVVIARVTRLLTERGVKVPPIWGDASLAA